MTASAQSRGGAGSALSSLASPAPAVALLRDRLARARVAEALRAWSSVVFVESADEVLARVAAGPVSLVILECRGGDDSPTVPAVHALRRGYPSVPIVAYTAPGRTASSDILAMAHAGVHELIIHGFDDVGVAIRAVAESASRRCAGARVLEALRADLPEDTIPFVQFCLERAASSPTVAEAARYLGVHRKTLVYRLKRTALPPPSAMIGWCRLFVAAQLLEDPCRSVAHVALALDFSSSAALRAMLRRYTGLRPQDVRELGGLGAVIASFQRKLAPTSG